MAFMAVKLRPALRSYNPCSGD